MALHNWLELAALLVVLSAGAVLWRALRTWLRRNEGFEGVVEEKGKPAVRSQMDVEEEIKHLEALLGRNDE